MASLNEKRFFEFRFFDELEIGDVFKFSPVMDGDMPSGFFTVYNKTETHTKINRTYGRSLQRQEFSNSIYREVMVFPYRNKNKQL